MKIAIVDIETTGFSPENECIVEVGITELDLETGETNLIYDELVKEGHFDESKKNSWIFKNTNLKYEDVMKAKPLDKKRIQEIFDTYKLTAYNKKFDFGFFKFRDFKFDELPCPMIIATNICKIVKKRGAGYKWPKVQEAWNFFFPDSGYVEEHRGGDDSVHEAKIVYELYKQGHFIV